MNQTFGRITRTPSLSVPVGEAVQNDRIALPRGGVGSHSGVVDDNGSALLVSDAAVHSSTIVSSGNSTLRYKRRSRCAHRLNKKRMRSDAKVHQINSNCGTCCTAAHDVVLHHNQHQRSRCDRGGCTSYSPTPTTVTADEYYNHCADPSCIMSTARAIELLTTLNTTRLHPSRRFVNSNRLHHNNPKDLTNILLANADRTNLPFLTTTALSQLSVNRCSGAYQNTDARGYAARTIGVVDGVNSAVHHNMSSRNTFNNNNLSPSTVPTRTGNIYAEAMSAGRPPTASAPPASATGTYPYQSVLLGYPPTTNRSTYRGTPFLAVVDTHNTGPASYSSCTNTKLPTTTNAIPVSANSYATLL
eukprot:Lankesteria_metandrocarpae@DN10448_c0_g1_i1.p1